MFKFLRKWCKSVEFREELPDVGSEFSTSLSILEFHPTPYGVIKVYSTSEGCWRTLVRVPSAARKRRMANLAAEQAAKLARWESEYQKSKEEAQQRLLKERARALHISLTEMLRREAQSKAAKK